MPKNILPDEYPTVWHTKSSQWMTLEDLAFEDPSLHNRFVNYKYDDDYGIVFLSDKLADSKHKYALCLAEIIVSGKSYYIESVTVLKMTNDSAIDFGLNPTPLSKYITQIQDASYYQYGYRFFLEDANTITKVKRRIPPIISNSWISHEDIYAF